MTVRAILFDIDGTLVFRGKAIAGAVAAVEQVRAQGIAVRFLTNTTARTPADIAAGLSSLGIPAQAADIQTPVTVCLALLAARPGVRCHLMLPPPVIGMFDDVVGIVRDDSNPELVVIGDMGERFDYATLNRAFLMLRAGAGLIALQKNLYWFAAEGARLDCGAFVLALEAASGVTAQVAGKPSREFFKTALAAVGCLPEQVLIVGDDVATDIAGGNAAGARTVLVGTGKFADNGQRGEETYFIDSVQRLPALLAKL